MDFARVTGHRFTKTSKALQLQLLGAHSADMQVQDTGFADAFGSWALIAIPEKPSTDPLGQITESAEAIFEEYGDEHLLLGTRDVRMAKFAQDVKPGEVALVNSDGFRLFLGRKKAALVVGGGYLSFDVEKKSIGLVGIPSTPGGSAPYISISPTILGLVSASGGSSLTLDGSNVTMSGASINLDFGRVNLGKGAADPIVTYSAFQQFLILLQTWAAAVGTATGAAPPPFILNPNKRVFAPAG